MCWGVLVRKFRYLTFVLLFAQASRSQEETQASTRPQLLKIGTCDSAIARGLIEVSTARGEGKFVLLQLAF